MTPTYGQTTKQNVNHSLRFRNHRIPVIKKPKCFDPSKFSLFDFFFGKKRKKRWTEWDDDEDDDFVQVKFFNPTIEDLLRRGLLTEGFEGFKLSHWSIGSQLEL